MDFRSCVEAVDLPASVLSVERTEKGTCGEIRLVCANQAFHKAMGTHCSEGSLYQENAPENNRFEDLCFRAAIQKERMHALVNTEFLGTWTEQFLFPLVSDDPNRGYCQFMFIPVPAPKEAYVGDYSLDTAALVLRSCMNLVSTDNFRENVGIVLEDIMKAAEAESGRIMLMNDYKKQAVLFCQKLKYAEWIPGDESSDVISYSLMELWDRITADCRVFVIQNEEEMQALSEQAPEWVQSMRAFGVKNLLMVPLRRFGQTVGYLYVCNYNVEKNAAVREMCELVSLFLSAEIANYLLYQRMEEISLFDELTGLKNRHAMLRKVDALGEQGRGVSFGILTMDLNGLKVVNDRDGHLAGDQLLVNTANTLSREYGKENLYRIGGDEFIILFPEISLEDFRRKREEFQSWVRTVPWLSLSVGSHWYPGKGDPEEAFYQADMDMYKDKRRFYEIHPELKH